jgi:hypothetical protein
MLSLGDAVAHEALPSTAAAARPRLYLALNTASVPSLRIVSIIASSRATAAPARPIATSSGVRVARSEPAERCIR